MRGYFKLSGYALCGTHKESRLFRLKFARSPINPFVFLTAKLLHLTLFWPYLLTKYRQFIPCYCPCILLYCYRGAGITKVQSDVLVNY